MNTQVVYGMRKQQASLNILNQMPTPFTTEDSPIYRLGSSTNGRRKIRRKQGESQLTIMQELKSTHYCQNNPKLTYHTMESPLSD